MTTNILRKLAVVIFVIALPVLIVTSNVKVLFLDPGYYDSNQANSGVPQTSGLTLSTLKAANRSMTAYFADQTSSLASELNRQGLPADFFSDREFKHMSDVRSLIWLVFNVQQLALGYVLLFLAANLVIRPRRFIRNIRGPLVWGAGFTLVLLVILGILSQIDFNSLFLFFHIVSFDNDLWALDPNTEVLLRLVPEVFWFNAAVMMTVYSLVEAMAIGIVGAALYWRRPARDLEPSKK